MRGLLMSSIVLTLVACAKQESASSEGAGRASPSGSSGSATSSDSAARAGSARAVAEEAPQAPPSSDSAANDGSEEVARLVVHDVGSKALGSQTIDPSCVSVVIMPSGDWTVAAARLKDCGDKTARSILWVYKRKNGKWSEDYLGQPPRCWKGVPPDIADAVTKATKIPRC